jgi:hypothetical protein
MVSTLYQDIFGVAGGSIVGFPFAHRGCLGVDTMLFRMTDLGVDGVIGGGDTTLFTNTYSDGKSAWGFYTGSGITALGNTVRFSFESVSAFGDRPSYGNFLDDVDFGVGVGAHAPEPATILLFGFGLLGFAGVARKTMKK